MALIHCPECGKEISDKAEKCIHCRHVMKEQPKIICEDCGNEIPEGAETCPVCGCPVKVEVEEKPIPVYLQPGTPPRKSLYAKIGKKGIAIGLAVILVLIGGGIAASKAIANQKRLMQLPKQLKSVLIIKQTTHLLLWLCILAQQKLKPAEVLSKRMV